MKQFPVMILEVPRTKTIPVMQLESCCDGLRSSKNLRVWLSLILSWPDGEIWQYFIRTGLWAVCHTEPCFTGCLVLPTCSLSSCTTHQCLLNQQTSSGAWSSTYSLAFNCKVRADLDLLMILSHLRCSPLGPPAQYRLVQSSKLW